nr:cytochrome P450 4C1-like [Onthophagus taurus]
MDVILTCVVLFFVSLFIYYLKYFNECSKLKGIDGPKVLPFIGNALDLSSPTKIVKSLLKFHKQFKGKNYRIFIGSQPYVIMSEPKHLEKVLSSSIPLKKSRPYDFLYNWLGSGLLTSYGKKWAKNRKIITPAFHFKILEDFVQTFNTSHDRLISKLSKEVGNEGFDVYPHIARCALDVICETAMGTCVNAQEDINSEYVKTVEKMGLLVIRRSFSPILQIDTMFKYFSSDAINERKYLEILHGYTRKIIKSRRLELYSNDKINSNGNDRDDFGIKKKRAFLDLLLEYQMGDPSFTDEDIREEVDTFTFEGHETTASTIAFSIHSLAMNPKIQQKAFKEVEEILKDDPKRHFTFTDLQEMKYMEMIIKEALRLYTTVPLYGRQLTEDFKMDDITLPKGIMLTIYAMGIHRNPEYFKDPEVFDPERFSPENTKGRSPFCFIPFSAGPRNCIGQKFAMLEVKATLANLLRNFVILPVNQNQDVILRNDLVLKSDNGIWIKLEKRL